MSAGTVDLLVEQGSDFAYTFTWKDSAGAWEQVLAITDDSVLGRLAAKRRPPFGQVLG